MTTPKTIELTPEMQERAAAFCLALRMMIESRTEAAAASWARSAERHRAELGQAIIMALYPSPRSAVQIMEGLVGEGVELAVATAGEEETCDE